ncbi:MAG: DEAD/DEAH box helicase family protein [Pseudomonadota bacterium]
MTQFAFLKAEFANVFAHAKKAEDLSLSDPRGACFYARLALETAITWMYGADKALREPYQDTLSALIHEPTFRKLVGSALVTKAKIIKDLGNRAVHDTRAVSEKSATTALRELFHFSYWFARTYARGEQPLPGIQFDPGKLERTLTIKVSTAQQIKKASDEAEARAKELEREKNERLKSESEREKLETEIKRLQDAIAATKKENAAAPDTHDYNEAQTRDAFIDLLLHEAGWPLDQERDREFPVTGMPNNTGEGFVDYVLWGDDGKPLAVVEAKRTRRDAQVGQQQAKLYADCLEKKFGQRPLIFYTNGYDHWFWDDSSYPPRSVQGFLKKSEMQLLIQRRTTQKPLGQVDIDTEIAGRYYQTRAIGRICESFEKDHLRKALLVMATGSGKTRTVIALTDLLMRANWVKRVLFLADRIALVKQAHNAFKAHLPSAPSANLLEKHDPKKNDHNGARVCLSTYPTMMGLINEMEAGARRFGPGHFDLIVIDEAHRSVYRKYRAIFDYFDSLLVGLTATPRDEIDRDTYSLFELERGVPTDAYDLEEAVADQYLVPPETVSVSLKFQRDGIKYSDLSDEDKERWDALEWSDESIVPPPEVEAGAINKWLFNSDTVDKALRYLMTHGLHVEEGDKLGKTIIFAKNSDHAEYIYERFSINYPHLKGHFARVIDYRIAYAQSLIDEFSDPKKDLQIAISVDMLDTGIDVPEVVNLLFFKIVRSKTKFWQMIGRGTRLCPNLFGPGRDKEVFRVFDFCQNFEFFSQNPTVSDGSLPQSLSAKIFIARVDLVMKIDVPSVDEFPDGFSDGAGDAAPLFVLRNETRNRLLDEVQGMSLENFVVRPHRRSVEKFQAEGAWSSLSQEDREELEDHVAGLPSAIPDDELEAKQFDYLILQTQLALLTNDASLTRLQERILAISAALEALQNIPMVAAELATILEIQTAEFWEGVTLPMLENIRKRLRKLVKLIPVSSQKLVYTDFEDEISLGSAVTLPNIGIGTNKQTFLSKVRHFLKMHEDHITLQKLKRNEQLTKSDIEELERIFREEAEADDDDFSIVQKQGGLGLFIRSLVGLDRGAAVSAFDAFIDGKSLRPNQIEFIDLIIKHLTERGTIDPRLLYESPFTDIDDQGVSGVFAGAEVRHLVEIIDDVKHRATG